MTFGVIDRSKKPQKLKLFLAKPDRTIIGILNNIYKVTNTIKLGAINELEFSLPIDIDVDHKLIQNPILDKLKHRYLIKAQLGSQVEWYIIDKIATNMEDTDYKTVSCFSLGYELADKNISGYSEESKNATEVLTDALYSSIWAAGYIDESFNSLYRAFDFSGTALDFVFNIAETFGAIVIWDTENRTVNFYKEDDTRVGIDRGLRIGYGKYLKTLNREDSNDEFVTRLYVYGKDRMSIQRVNPSGSPYIEDFSFFMYPFERDFNIVKWSLFKGKKWSEI